MGAIKHEIGIALYREGAITSQHNYFFLCKCIQYGQI